ISVLEVELVRPLVDLVNRLARHEPQGRRLAAPAVLLARPRLRERRVRRRDRARVLERLAAPRLPEHLEDGLVGHAAASTESRTQRSCSMKRRRSSSRSSVFGPCPVTTCLSSSQSGSLYSHVPSSRRRSFGSGTVRPSSRICGTYPSRNC